MSARKLAWVTPWVSLALVSTSGSMDWSVGDTASPTADSVRIATQPVAIAADGDPPAEPTSPLAAAATDDLDLANLTVAWTIDGAEDLCPAHPLQLHTDIPQQLPRDFSHYRIKADASVRHQLKYLMQALMSDSTLPQASLVEITTDNQMPVVTDVPQDIWHVWQQLYSSVNAVFHPQEQMFYLWVNGRLILKSTELAWLDSIAAALEEVLSQRDFEPEQIVPIQTSERRPAIRVSEEFVVLLDKTVEEETKNRDLLAIEGANHLREALGVEPLELVEAQRSLYALEQAETVPFGGIASWYGPQFHGQLTANGEVYDQEAFTAAHPYLPFDTYLQVTNLETEQSVIIRINDRGPFIAPRTLDLSRGVARCIDSKQMGVVPYEAVILNAS